MIYLQILVIFIMTLLLNSCVDSENDNIKNEKTIIAGKILDYKPSETKITIIKKDLCVNEKREILEIDSLGNFHYRFNSNSKRDLRIKSNNANFLVLIYPGDSLYVEFKSIEKQFWNHIKFRGDRKTENIHLTEFQKTFQNQSVSYEKINQQKTALNENSFVQFMDSVQNVSMKIVDSFSRQMNLTKTELNWISWYASEPYYYNLFWYPIDKGIEVSSDYYSFQDKLIRLLSDDMAATYNIDLFIGEYFSGSIKPNFFKDNQQLIDRWKKNPDLSKKLEHIGDSLMNLTILKYANGKNAKELALTYWYSAKIRNGDIKAFESFQKFLKKEISSDYLRKSLFDYYHETKSMIENALSGEEITENVGDNSIKQILDSIFISNKDKVIVFDFWATYCGPCIANFSKMNSLMKELDNQSIDFVFFCLDGSKNEKKWKDLIKTHSVLGTHYCLNDQQADELKKILEIKGVPHHAIFDKKGNLKKNGYLHLDKNELIAIIHE